MTGFLRRPRCGHDPPAQAVLSPLSVLRPCGGWTLRLRPSPRPPPRPLGDAAGNAALLWAVLQSVSGTGRGRNLFTAGDICAPDF